MTDTRLIEAGFPCHQVGAETQRERGASSALPPLYFMHVWWARRPLTPSRAAIAGSLLPSDTDVNEFIQDLGIEKVVALVDGQHWVLSGKLLAKVERVAGAERLPIDKTITAALGKEKLRRKTNREAIALLLNDPKLRNHPSLMQWEKDSSDINSDLIGQTYLEIIRVAATPSEVNEKIAFAKLSRVKEILGSTIKWDTEDLYGYSRAYQNDHKPVPSGLTVLDPTSGGGSIPFEALRLGHKVIANELNPVASTILHATLEYPAKFGLDLKQDIEKWGQKLLAIVEAKMEPFTPFSIIPKHEHDSLKKLMGDSEALTENFEREYDHQGLLHCRLVTCPHCAGDAPLLNFGWLSKDKDPWGVEVIANPDKTVSFKPYPIKGGMGPNGQNPDEGTVKRGVGQCVHCHQAIDGDEIKAQACGTSQHGRWSERMFAIMANRLEPKMKNGQVERIASGPNKGQIKTKKVRYFRAPNEADLAAQEAAKKYLEEKWFDWEIEGLIPTEKFPKGEDMRPINYGMPRWCDMFTPRQLVGHVTQIEELNRLKPQILAELGQEKGKAVITYLQFAIDKMVDYNSKQTRWIPQRCSVSGTFGRHDFSLKWTFGEMVYSGPNSGARWGLSQVLDAYEGIAELVKDVKSAHSGEVPVQVINGSGGSMTAVGDKSVDLVCFDPPYYDNVQYSELSDYYYVWQKRTLADLYPGYFNRTVTEKSAEAVANQTRDGKEAYQVYEDRMAGIFSECLRVLKDEGVMTLMFTHKSQDAWEALTQSLIKSGWVITSAIPVDSEFSAGLHIKDTASASSSIFITCRKAERDEDHSSFWRLGQNPVQKQIGEEVVKALAEFEALKLNPVDRMVASYGRALKVLSENWPVMDEGEQVTPARAMQEAAQVVARNEVYRITQGRIAVEDLDAETAMAVMALGLWGHSGFDYDDALNLTRSLKVTMESKTAGYRPGESMVGYNTEERRRGAAQVARDVDGWHAPLVRKGSKLRLAGLNERSSQRLQNPVTLWDILHGTLAAYEEGGIVQARNYLTSKADDKVHLVRGLLAVWAEEVDSEKLKEQAESLLFELND
ncbi:DNA methylase [Vibrio parahaemolyticus]|uniref:DUF1156 domain-containing protein n=1 Tax=Vibrio parahaemolyticus TaxID=670 RepID=UPI00084A355C|nr:DUF1156 domain-containing protein [Vibrio parahaemolyticus]ODW58669.1 DNA methylase [Vibrio parahaemolyticus]